MDTSQHLPGPRYPIRAVSKLTGVPVDTLRAWERRHGVLRPARDERGRMYSDGDVRKIRLLRALIARGHPIGRLAALGEPELTALEGGATPPARPAGGWGASPRGETSSHDALAVVAAALARFDTDAAERELRRLAALLPPAAFVREVALPLSRLVGEAWACGQLSIAQEHLATAALRDLLGSLLRVHASAGAAPALLFATLPGERHELGVLAAALLAAAAGLRVLYLGPDVPVAELALAARRAPARAVVMGALCVEGGGGPARALGELARQLPAGTELWVGGPPTPEVVEAVAAGGGVFLPDLDAFEARLPRLRT